MFRLSRARRIVRRRRNNAPGVWGSPCAGACDCLSPHRARRQAIAPSCQCAAYDRPVCLSRRPRSAGSLRAAPFGALAIPFRHGNGRGGGAPFPHSRAVGCAFKSLKPYSPSVAVNGVSRVAPLALSQAQRFGGGAHTHTGRARGGPLPRPLLNKCVCVRAAEHTAAVALRAVFVARFGGPSLASLTPNAAALRARLKTISEMASRPQLHNRCGAAAVVWRAAFVSRGVAALLSRAGFVLWHVALRSWARVFLPAANLACKN